MTGNDSSNCVLDTLKTVDIFLSGAKKKRISIVEARANQGRNDNSAHLLVIKVGDFTV